VKQAKEAASIPKSGVYSKKKRRQRQRRKGVKGNKEKASKATKKRRQFQKEAAPPKLLFR